MFGKDQKKAHRNYAAFADKVSIVAEGMQIHGDIDSDSDIRIDGVVFGNVSCKSKVVVIATGKVTGDIKAANIDIHGCVDGNIIAHDLLSLKSHCSISGNLKTQKLQIEPNAVFNGHCTMTTAAASIIKESTLSLQNN